MRRKGPKVTLDLSCKGCEHERSASYAVQGDSGFVVSCAHPDGKGRIGDTTWDTPDWCPLRAAALAPVAPDPSTGLDVAFVGDAEGVAALVGLDAPSDNKREPRPRHTTEGPAHHRAALVLEAYCWDDLAAELRAEIAAGSAALAEARRDVARLSALKSADVAPVLERFVAAMGVTELGSAAVPASRTIWGYVARGNLVDSEAIHYVVAVNDPEGDGYEIGTTPDREHATEFASLTDAAGALWNTDVLEKGTVLAVYDDGTERALPSYEQAIASLGLGAPIEPDKVPPC